MKREEEGERKSDKKLKPDHNESCVFIVVRRIAQGMKCYCCRHYLAYQMHDPLLALINVIHHTMPGLSLNQ